ncbi:MAG: hypothetical protein U5L09_07940 [Bacteroidales bacterium]|nr:hypothetical protein [Bacteroidales bacterium]
MPDSLKKLVVLMNSGSGIRNTYKYASVYSNGKTPRFLENDIFSIRIPLPEEMHEVVNNFKNDTANDTANDTLNDTLTVIINDAIEDGRLRQYSKIIEERFIKILKIIHMEPKVNSEILANKLNKSIATIKRDLSDLKSANIIEFRGASTKTGSYFIRDDITNRK